MRAETPEDAIAIALVRRPDLWRFEIDLHWTNKGWSCSIVEGNKPKTQGEDHVLHDHS